jgi:bifunctional non-homologous end joining protein LigD
MACDANGLAVFERLRRKPTGRHVLLYAFDLLELDGEDLRREPFATRKATLASLLRANLPGLRLNEHLTHDGDVVSATPASSGSRASSPSGWARATAPAAPATGSSSRTRTRRR